MPFKTSEQGALPAVSVGVSVAMTQCPVMVSPDTVAMSSLSGPMHGSESDPLVEPSDPILKLSQWCLVPDTFQTANKKVGLHYGMR